MHSFTQAFVPWALPGIILVSALGALVMCLLVFRYGFPSAEPHPGAPRGSSGDAVLIIRMGHAIAGACFAIAALLAVVVLAQSARSNLSPEPSAIPNVVAQGEIDALRQALAETEAHLARAESRLSAAAAEAEMGRSRVENLEARVLATETSLHRVSEESSRALAATKQLSAGTPPRRPAAVASGPPATPPSPPRAVPSSPPAAEPARRSLEVARPAPDAASPSRPLDPAPDASQRVTGTVTTAPPSATPRSEPDPEPSLGTKLREDWELVKREGRDAFRRLREALR